ncbi:uncharacterized protein LOC131294543 [Anopheles ziemanni]|uniref:uncharacterized protein LOC131265174 n=1 Tax=Anopheles coustani TaxID=139045 RepID=UPI00265ADDF5|nr:uncharacterized protein LOC131265174 [Anopheles coustani]XP_058178572.1 uncharacterized protein LOC131294543 [Anopheles ziemanni]
MSNRSSNSKPDNNSKSRNSNRNTNNNNKASKDGVDFQYHLYYFIIGLCHDKYKYSALYEGDMATYGALDDVILKIKQKDGVSSPEALYFIQAKQFQSKERKISLFDLLHPKDGFTKYIEAYKTYKLSETCIKDGLPTQMIYWTSLDIHSTTKQLMDVFQDSEDHLKIINVADTSQIEKYWIKDWKKLFIFEIASKLKDCAESSGKLTEIQQCKCESLAQMLVKEVVEQVPPEYEEDKPKLKLRKAFLYRDTSLSEYATILRDCYDLAYQTGGKKADWSKLEGKTFDDIFGVNFDADIDNTESTFEYKGLTEQELNWFFEHFIYYVNVPKGEKMVTCLNNLYNGNFNEQIFEKYLIPKGDVHLGFVRESLIDSIIQTVKITTELNVAPLTSIEFSECKELQDIIGSLFNPITEQQLFPEHQLTIIAKTHIDWTVSRVLREVRKMPTTWIVVQEKDEKRINDALQTVIHGEMQTIIAVDLKNPPKLPKQLRLICILSPDSKYAKGSFFEDQISMNDIEKVHFDQFGDKTFIIDEKEIKFSECWSKNTINDKIETLAELYDLSKLEVKSDVYDYNEKHYIERELIEKNRVVAQSALTSDQSQAISIISDTAGQGKTIELLRIAKTAPPDTITLFFRAKTIANVKLSGNVNAYQCLSKLLHIEPRSSLTDEIVLRCLEQSTVLLLVDGFDEIVEDSQTLVVKFMKCALQQTSCSLIIATRTESKSKLESAFKNAKCYTLGKFAYDQYFEQLWIKDRTEPATEVLRSNLKYFIENFDTVLKRAGCKIFLEVPQFCRIMGSIYQERIGKENFKLHNNYEIGAIYDAFVQSQFANTFEGYFDERKLKDLMAVRVLKENFYTRHMELAYYNQYNRCRKVNLFKDLVYYDLIMNQDDQYEFIHITVMEYFLVRYFMVEEIGESNKVTFLRFLERYFCVNRVNIADKFIDFFLSNGTCYNQTETRRDVILKYLQSNPRNLPAFVRTTLNNATFNTLKLLLTVSPEPMLLDLCFRFGSVKQTNDGKKGKGMGATYDESIDNEINLKRLGENQMILLLQALEESCSDRPKIIENVLFPTDPNEEDFIEVSLRKPFPEVFDKVVNYCTKNCIEKFKDHIEARLEQYAVVIVQHCYAENKERMIDKITQLCKDKLDAGTISSYLKSFDFFKILVENIEVVTAGKKFIETDRLNLLGKILSMLSEFLDPESLAVRKLQGRVQIIALTNESIKNRLNEWLDE